VCGKTLQRVVNRWCSLTRFHSRSLTVHYIGVDLHKKTISVCVVIEAGRQSKVVARTTVRCDMPEKIRAFFEKFPQFQVAVEATASYEWFLQLIEASAERVVLVHPKKLRIIAESVCKTDKIDAFILADLLRINRLPEASRPTPRQREHRALVRHRCYVQRRITSVKNKIRFVLADYNADRRSLFSAAGKEYLDQVKLSASDRYVVEQLWTELEEHHVRLLAANRRLREFAAAAPTTEKEAREVLATMPQAGPVTVDVIVSELGDIRRFRSAKKATSYAGLAPGERSSGGKTRQLGITKEGSRLLRWGLIQWARRVVRHSRRWSSIYEKLMGGRPGEDRDPGAEKKAIVAVARRLLCVAVSMLRSGQRYRYAADEIPAGTTASKGRARRSSRPAVAAG
jgi:transposase